MPTERKYNKHEQNMHKQYFFLKELENGIRKTSVIAIINNHSWIKNYCKSFMLSVHLWIIKWIEYIDFSSLIMATGESLVKDFKMMSIMFTREVSYCLLSDLSKFSNKQTYAIVLQKQTRINYNWFYVSVILSFLWTSGTFLRILVIRWLLLYETLTRWLPTTSILAVIGKIYRYQLKCNYLKNRNYIFRVYIKFWTFWEKGLLA